MKRLIREPFVHFLLLGAVLFVLHGFLNEEESAPGSIVVTAGQIENMNATFARVWQRTPTATELKGLVNDHVKEEILNREAVKLGLDQNDTVIRRRLKQKMEFLAEDLVVAAEPSDKALAAYLEADQERFLEEPRFTFRQIFLNPERRGEQLESEARDLLQTLGEAPGEGANLELGDRTLLPPEMKGVAQHDIASLFGEAFAESLETLAPGTWHGPIRSGFGFHLVQISDRTEARLPSLEEVRAQVEREWVNDQRIQTNRQFLDGLLEHYQVTIEWPVENDAQRTAQLEARRDG